MTGRGACVVLGGGGHARALLECLELAGWRAPLLLLDNDPSQWGGLLQGAKVLGGDELLPGLAAQGVRFFLVGLGGVGRGDDNARRQALYQKGLAAGLEPLTVVHPSAVVSPRASLGPGCQLLPGCLVNTGAVLGANVIVNTGAIVEHDCRVGEHAHLATGSCLGGGVRLGRRCHLGLRAAVRQYLEVGDDVIIGAGAVVVGDLSAGQTVVGVPARPLRPQGL